MRRLDGAAVRVHRHAAPLVMRHAGRLEVQPVQRHLPPDGHQQVRPGDPCAPSASVDGHAPRRRDPFDGRAFADLHALGAQMSSTTAASSGSSRPSAAPLDHRHRAAQPAMRLRHLQPDRPAADHDQMLGPLAQFEDRLVGQVGHPSSPGIGGTAGREPVAMTKRRAGCAGPRLAPRSGE
jgi:hypothetical protein